MASWIGVHLALWLERRRGMVVTPVLWPERYRGKADGWVCSFPRAVPLLTLLHPCPLFVAGVCPDRVRDGRPPLRHWGTAELLASWPERRQGMAVPSVLWP